MAYDETRDVPSVRAEITKRLESHAEALRSGEVESALKLYTDDAVVRPANMEPVRGRDALRKFLSNWFAAMAIKEIAYATEELEVRGDMAYQIGVYRGVLQHGQTALADRGSFHIAWKRQADGSWRYHRGIFNSSEPTAVPRKE